MIFFSWVALLYCVRLVLFDKQYFGGGSLATASLKTCFMRLMDLKYGNRFEFADKLTLIEFRDGSQPGHTAMGTFTYITVCDGTTPKLLHEESGKEFIARSGVFYRDVFMIF